MFVNPSPRRLTAISSVLAWAALAGTSCSQEPVLAEHANRREVRVLFFNTHLLPGVAQRIAGKRGQDDYRSHAIAAQLGNYDVVGLCEVFERRRRREIVHAVEEAAGGRVESVELPLTIGRNIVGGGLLLISRFPLDGKPHFHTYSAASRVLSNGVKADGLAAKGVIHARVVVDQSSPLVVDCFLTHLESISAAARNRQIDELAAFIAQNGSPERPLLLMGDLNVAADPADRIQADSEYGRLTNRLRLGSQRLIDAWPTADPTLGGTSDALALDQARRIDYIFVSPPNVKSPASWQILSVKVLPFLDSHVTKGSLSDHAAVECTLKLSPRDAKR